MKKTAVSSLSMAAFPVIVPGKVVNKKRGPNDKINIAQIGFGRIARGHDLPETIKHTDQCRVVAVADVDMNRANLGKQWIERWYAENESNPMKVSVKAYQDYREMLKDTDIDAVIISTPDHWHAQPTIEAALLGKHVYLQKPASLTIKEGRQMSDVVNRSGITFQIGSQQRSISPWPQFKRAAELVRNGRIGTLEHVEVGLWADPSGDDWPVLPVPEHLDYDMWLGSTPYIPYTEKRVHPQSDFSRPGWLRVRQFGAGMITGWGAHHIDTAHWGMDTEYTGPIEIEAEAEFPTEGMWNVHGKFRVLSKYANGITMDIRDDFPNGVKFIGSEGWIFVSRGPVSVTSSDPSVGAKKYAALEASKQAILDAEVQPDEVLLYESPEQHLNWLNCIRSKQKPVAPAEVAHRSCTACLLSHIAMQLDRKLHWDPIKERFVNDDTANGLVDAPQRYPYGTEYVLEGFLK